MWEKINNFCLFNYEFPISLSLLYFNPCIHNKKIYNYLVFILIEWLSISLCLCLIIILLIYSLRFLIEKEIQIMLYCLKILKHSKILLKIYIIHKKYCKRVKRSFLFTFNQIFNVFKSYTSLTTKNYFFDLFFF